MLWPLALQTPTIERGEPLVRPASFALAAAPVEGGVRVAKLFPNGAAVRAGLRVGDVITTADGAPVPNGRALALLARQKGLGESVPLRVTRDGKTVDLSVTLAERPKQTGDGFDVRYDQVVSDGKRIRVIVTTPKGKGPFPTIFLIGGIGAYSVDGDWTDVPYGDILGPLSKRFATVRMDKPGQGDSEGPAYPGLGFGVERDAYVQALRLAKTLPGVDPNRIVLFGHSMGGSFAPLVAERERVAGIVVGGTLVRTWTEYLLENTRRQSALAGATPGEMDEALKRLAEANHYLYTEGLSPKEVEAKNERMAKWIAEEIPDRTTYSGVGLPFFQELARTNLAAAWEKVTVPTLAFWGDSDFLASLEDHKLIAEIVSAKKPGRGEYLVLKNTDHGFKRRQGQADSFKNWSQPGGQFAPEIITVMERFVQKATAPGSGERR